MAGDVVKMGLLHDAQLQESAGTLPEGEIEILQGTVTR